MSKSVYETIKRQNGEAFAQAIRRFDNGIFDIKNLPEMVKYAGRNALPLLSFLEGLKKVEILDVETGKDPFQLLSEAGYDAFYADTLEKQNSIYPYYTENEALCTFMDKSRYIRYHIIHAVKKGAEKLKREDFKGREEREDAYGVSVLSIQILKEGGFISIKNRYNHGVENSDNTYNSNPDNIIKGLSLALKRHFNVDFSSQEKDLPTGYQFIDGKIYQFHTESEHIYFGNGYYIQNGVVHHLDTDYEFVVDDFIIDLKNKKVKTPISVVLEENQPAVSQDKIISTCNLSLLIEDELKDKLLRVSKAGDEKALYANGNLILRAKNNQLTHLYLPTTKRRAHRLFCFHPTIEEFKANALFDIRGPAFYHCSRLKTVEMPVVKEVGNLFITECPHLNLVELPSLEKMGNNCFSSLLNMRQLVLFSLKSVGSYSLRDLRELVQLSAPQLNEVGLNSLKKMFKIKELILPSLSVMTNSNLCACPMLEVLKLPKVEKMDDYCLQDLPKLKEIELPLLKQMGDFCFNHLGIEKIELPLLTEVGSDNFQKNDKLKTAIFSNLKKANACFLAFCSKLVFVSVPKMEVFQRDIFKGAKKLKAIQADSLLNISKDSGLKFLTGLKCLYAPKVDERLLFAVFYLHPQQETLLAKQKSNDFLLSMIKKKKEHTNG